MLWILALALGCAAAFEDIRHSHIPNWIPGAALGAALLYQTWSHGGTGLAMAAAGTAIGFAIFLVFYGLGAMGGGDIKLMAAFGALLGPSGTLVAAVLAAIIGALLAAGVVVWSRCRTIPYAPAIVLGSWLALLGKG